MSAQRITVAQLAARLDAQDTVLVKLTELVTALAAQPQFATPVPVVEAVTEPVAKPAKPAKASKGKTAKAATAQVAAPAKKASAKPDFAALKVGRDAISPVNKALAKALGTSGDAWTNRWANVEAVNAALGTLTPEQAQAALPFVQAKVAKAQA